MKCDEGRKIMKQEHKENTERSKVVREEKECHRVSLVKQRKEKQSGIKKVGEEKVTQEKTESKR